jgi:hypothetical protein
MVDWTSPVTSRVLLEGSAIHRIERWGAMHYTDTDAINPAMVSVIDNGPGAFYPGLRYRSAETYSNNFNTTFHWTFKVSYITGAHAFKFGINDGWGESDLTTYTRNDYSYTFVTPVGLGATPVPTTITERATPFTQSTRMNHDTGLFAQDKWTAGRSTISLGVRYDHINYGYPEQTMGPTPLAPNRNLVFPESELLHWNDITPKLGYAYDVFGNGKTAVKVSLNKYLRGYGTSFSLIPDPNATNAAVTNTTRDWTDANHNYYPDCDLTTNTPGANGECGALASPFFGSSNPAVASQLKYDSNLAEGWGKRDYNWELTAGVQHELAPRVSLDVGYFRRWYGNFHVQDNELLNADSFNYITIHAPADPRLPGGGNYDVTGFPVIKPDFPTFLASFIPQNRIRLSEDVGKQIEHWNGVDVNLNWRATGGFMAQGGFSTGRTSTDNCDIIAKQPENAFESLNFFSPNFFTTIPTQFCHRDGAWLTQVKGFALYTIPKIDVQFSGTYQDLPGVPVEARYSAPFLPTVGGLQSLPFASFYHIMEPGVEYGGRLHQLDLRIGKVFRAGRTRTTINLDIYNLFNVDTITLQSNNYFPNPAGQATWQVPQQMLQARFIKIGAAFDF